MSRHRFALFLASVTVAAAQSTSSPATDQPAVDAAEMRTVSPATAELLRASLPKIAAVKPGAESPDLRETDRPRNDIIRLPKYLVRQPKPPVFTDRELLGESAFGDKLARLYYPEWYLALNKVARFTPLALFMWSARDSALAQFYEEERLGRMADFADLTNMVMRSDPVAGAKVKDLTQEMFMRSSDFGWQGGLSK